ncbi:PilN domain-containing protein [Candidatus Falkowbacteria bacterium]|nr:PilN domain-containing protein [Candidatus Falkowbacteria bacterium]
MLSLNLIPHELKQEVKLKRIYGLLRKMNFVLIIIIAAAASILLAAKFILQNNFNEVVAQTTLVTKNSQGYNAKVREINSQLNIISQLQNNFTAWSLMLEDLAEMTPRDMTFTYVKLNKEERSLKIKGRAASRDGLLALKQSLEDSKDFTNVEFPIRNILKQNDIDFEINAKINLK